MKTTAAAEQVEKIRKLPIIKGKLEGRHHEILSPDAQEFLATLHNKFESQRQEILKKREERQEQLDKGELPDFRRDTVSIRNGDWTVEPIPAEIKDRRVEITGPVDRKMMINAFNSGAKVFMADLEDSTSPTWENLIEGQVNLYDAVRKEIDFYDKAKDKSYALNDEIATLFVRPRGWHLDEAHFLVDGKPMSGSLFDFGLYFFNNAQYLLDKNSAPYFYLAKLECYEEAKMWNDVFEFAQDKLNIPLGTIKATVLVETITAVFELNEILYALKDHSAGLNCGRWDYIFSYIKKFRNDRSRILPNRDQVTMKVPFMDAYVKLVIQTCHKRKAHAMGGMAAQIPIKNDPAANEAAIKKVRDDKLREVDCGHDGTWVAHPGLVPVAMEVFDTMMPGENQIDYLPDYGEITKEQLLEVPEGTITEDGIRKNINIGIRYIANWLSGNGAVALEHLMEDAATAEISRTQLWQWLKNQVKLEDGRAFTKDLYQEIRKDEENKIKTNQDKESFDPEMLPETIQLFDELVLNDELTEFLTIPAYNKLINRS